MDQHNYNEEEEEEGCEDCDDVEEGPTILAPLMAGAVAGMVVDVSLFPLDTVKTRLQSQQGFWRAGGFRHLYKGIGPAALGSAPNAALFFCTYEGVKQMLATQQQWEQPAVHMLAAACGEVAACTVRVPTEVVKQRRQTQVMSSGGSWQSYRVLRAILAQEGWRGLYRGYWTTMARELPFSIIQFPLWEGLKRTWGGEGDTISPLKSAICGAIAGAVAAGATTPIDVAKTRTMLAAKGTPDASGNLVAVLQRVYKNDGLRGVFAGVVPRVTWISMGGFVFLGAYAQATLLMR